MLVNCVAYRDGKKVADIPKEDIHKYLGEPGTFVWVALKDPEPIELDEMQREFDLHEVSLHRWMFSNQLCNAFPDAYEGDGNIPVVVRDILN